uniref:Selenoprotein P n=1 Tax=Malurus cyaneus samueli TaxID=2593467 RepID=A0A8C5TM58_9PASS
MRLVSLEITECETLFRHWSHFVYFLSSQVKPSHVGCSGAGLALCLLPGGATEIQNCQEPPEWRIGEEDPMLNSRGLVTVVALLLMVLLLYIPTSLEDLRVKLENEGLFNISYVVVNHQGAQSRREFHLLKERVSDYITVYQQDEQQDDVWTTLNGNKDDFLIYDRCGRLVYHLGLPYSFLHFQYVEESIKIAYCENKCGNCSYTVFSCLILCVVEKNTDIDWYFKKFECDLSKNI